MSRPPRYRDPVALAFGRVLSTARHEADVTRNELATAGSFLRSYVLWVEKGFLSPNVTELLVIAQAVKIDPTELIRRTVLALQSDDTAKGDQS